MKWRDKNGSPVLEWEVDALKKDEEGRTPLSLACFHGNREAALLLYRWNSLALSLKDNKGVDAIKHALEKGYKQLAEELKKLNNEKCKIGTGSTRSMIAAIGAPPCHSTSFDLSSTSPMMRISSSTSASSLSVPETTGPNVSSDGFLRPSSRR